MSAPYTPENFLDRHTPARALLAHDQRTQRRERALLDRHLGLHGGCALAVGCGWHPGRHLLPAPAWRLTAVDVDPACPAEAVRRGAAEEGMPGRAGHLDELDDGAYDVVLYRLVLHHIAYIEPLAPVFAEAARLLRPGGAMVAVEPGVRHPVGAALAVANRLGLGVRVHGTPDDIPLSPARLRRDARAAGLTGELHAVSYTWRRLPAGVQRAVGALDRFGSLPGARAVGHTLLLIARRP